MKPPYIVKLELSSGANQISQGCYDLILLVCFALSVYFLQKAERDFKNITFDYFLLIDNWSQPTISDIVLAQNGTCPDGYSTMTPYTWGGSKKF